MIRTVLGNIEEKEITACLCHEHICCISEYVFKACGKEYLNKTALKNEAVKELKGLKERYGLNLFIDCTPLNLGRDTELLKNISYESEVNIVCSTGFYYTEEVILYNTSAEKIAEILIKDAVSSNAGIIKTAVESSKISSFNRKLLKASAKAQLFSGLPIVLHTNANNQNGAEAVEALLNEGVKPQAITVGHLSDTEDVKYIKSFAEKGCYIGFDRFYSDYSEEYINRKVRAVNLICSKGFEDKLLFSHDELFFNGFEPEPKIKEKTRFSYCFENIAPRISEKTAKNIILNNPLRMLKCE